MSEWFDDIQLEHLDEAVATVAEICGIAPEIARRAINAASARLK